MKEIVLIPGWLLRDVNRAVKRRDEMSFGKRYIDNANAESVHNPDTFGIKSLPPLSSNGDVIEANIRGELTNRQSIAALIRELTYREIKQIEQEIKKCSTAYSTDEPHDWDVAQTLDDWAHMVKDEQEFDVDHVNE